MVINRKDGDDKLADFVGINSIEKHIKFKRIEDLVVFLKLRHYNNTIISTLIDEEGYL